MVCSCRYCNQSRARALSEYWIGRLVPRPVREWVLTADFLIRNYKSRR